MTNLLELLNGTLVNTTALVDQVTGSGRLCDEEGMSATEAHQGTMRCGSDAIIRGDFDLLPESTCPMTTTLMWLFSSLPILKDLKDVENGSVKLVGDLRD